MPRAPRRKSESNIYHIMLRGINRQVVFEDKEDYSKFLEILKKYKAVSGYKLFAYCLMANHIHILLKVEKEDLPLVVKRIAGSYVYWYNWKYYRKGPLFQDRYKSEPVENDGYFTAVVRYIHQNPVKAGIVRKIGDYKYSSYNDYISNKKDTVDTDFAMSLIGKNDFVKFNSEKEDEDCLDVKEQTFRMSDNDAVKLAAQISRCKNADEFKLLDKSKRDKYIKELKHEGLSIRQISRITGISFAVVRKI